MFTRDGKTYRPPVLVLYRDVTDGSCGGPAQKSMGPFYCPVDQKVYLDTSFFRELETRFGGCSGKACQFAQAYVIAHEVGHHVQNLLGVLPRAQQAQQSARSKADANAIQVRVELQADCLAGVWAKHENDRETSQGKPPFIDQSDVDGGTEDGGGHRRRHAAEARAGLCRAGQLHPRQLGTAPALGHHRAAAGNGRELQHIRRLQYLTGQWPESIRADSSSRSSSRS